MARVINKIIEYGFYLLLFLLPIQTRLFLKQSFIDGTYFEYGTISLYVVDILLFLIFSLFVFLKLQQKSKNNAKIKTYWWILAGLEFFIFLSCLFAPDFILAIYGYFRFLLGVALFWILIESRFDNMKLMIAFGIGVLVQALFGVWQFLTQSTFSNKYLGMASHSPGDLGVSVVETLKGERWLRAYGGLDHPNMLGGLLVVGILMIVLLMIRKNKNKILGFLGFAFLIVMFMSLFFTFSRAAWAGFLIGFIVLLAVAILKKDFYVQKKLLEILLVLGIFTFVLFSFYGDLVLTRLSNDTRLENKSNIERVESYLSAGDVIKSKWFFGTGINSYSLSLYKDNSERNVWDYQPVHNVFLLVWSEIGILGLLFFVGLFIYVGYSVLKFGDWYDFSLLLSIMLMFLVDHWWWSFHFGILLMFFVLGYLLKNNKS